jgi:hypothetical protein
MPNSAAPGPLEFYKDRFQIENNLTRNILRSIPPDKLDYRPHERSFSTGQIAWTIIRGLYIRVDMVSNCVSDVIRDPPPGLAEILERFEETSRRHIAQLQSFPAEQWTRVGQLRVGGRVALEEPAGPTSSGFSTSMRSITAARSPPTCAPWEGRFHRFMAPRETQRFHKHLARRFRCPTISQ